MKQKYYLTMSVVAIAMATLLCGCGNVDGNITSVEFGEDSRQTSEFESNLPIVSSEPSIRDGVIESKIDLSTQCPTTAKIYRQKRKTFTEEQFFNLFDEEPRKNNRSTPDYLVYDNDHQHAFLYEGKNLTFYTDTGDLFDSVYLELSENPDKIAKEYIDEKGELSFSSRNEALEIITEQMQSKFDISSDEWEVDSFVAVNREAVDQYKDQIIQNAHKSEGSGSIAENNGDEKAKALADGIFFEIHGSELKPDPAEIASQATKICKSHRAFFLSVGEHALNSFLAAFVKLAQGRSVPVVLYKFKVVRPNVLLNGFYAFLVLGALVS